MSSAVRSPLATFPASPFAQNHSLALAIVGIEAHQNELIAAGVGIGAVALHPDNARVRARQSTDVGAWAVGGPGACGAAGRQQTQRSEGTVQARVEHGQPGSVPFFLTRLDPFGLENGGGPGSREKGDQRPGGLGIL